MKRYILPVIFALLIINVSYSQQIPLYSQYYVNPFIYNPAMTGSGDNINAFLTYRSQWVSLPGAPVTSALTVDGPIEDKKIGLGINIFNDITDITNQFRAHASYSYKLELNSESKMLLGVALGVIDNKIDFSKAIVQDITDPYLFGQPQRKTAVDANFGVAYFWKKLEVGGSVPQLMANKLKYETNDFQAYYNLSRHYLLSAKYSFDVIPDKNIIAYPSILLRTASGSPLQYDVNAVLDWKNTGWFALSYRSNYAIGLNLGVKYQGLTVGFAYDIITSAIRSYGGSSSEIILGYSFGGFKKGKEEEKDTIAEILSKKNEEEIANLLTKISQNEEQQKENKAEIEKMKEELEKYKTALSDTTRKQTIKPETEEEKKKQETEEERKKPEIPEGEKKEEKIISERTGSRSDFMDEKNNLVSKGYYIVVGAFKNREFAEKEKKKYKEKGYKDCGIIYSNKKETNYVYLVRFETREEAEPELKKVRIETPDAWLQIIE